MSDDQQLKLFAVGDISFGDHYFSLGHGPRGTMEKEGYTSVFSEVENHLRLADIMFGNLECVISNEGSQEDSFSSIAFRGLPEAAYSLSSANFNVLNVANNHILQHGEEAFDDTLSRLDNEGINAIGLLGQGRYYSNPKIIIKKGIKVGFLGYSDVVDQYQTNQSRYARYILRCVQSDIELLRSLVDVVVVSLHFGVEAVNNPAETQIAEARKIADTGADIILGHHPHVFHKVERYNSSIIAYSLGNFVFDLPWDDRLTTSGILEIKINQELEISFNVVPVVIKATGYPKVTNNLPSSIAISAKIEREDSQVFEYEFTNPRNSEAYRKLAYLFKNIFRGTTRLKLQFLFWKVRTYMEKLIK